jgi:hypothetical protein
MPIALRTPGKPICYAVAVIGMVASAAISVGPMAAFLPELFATRYRYSGTAFSGAV